MFDQIQQYQIDQHQSVRHWFVVHTKPRKETYAQWQLARRGVVTFLFGLVHGFGFAGVLGEVGLPASQFAWALFQFNLGLELGQLAIVVPLVGLLFALRGGRRYAAWVIGGGSAACIAMGSAWFVARTTGLALPI